MLRLLGPQLRRVPRVPAASWCLYQSAHEGKGRRAPGGGERGHLSRAAIAVEVVQLPARVPAFDIILLDWRREVPADLRSLALPPQSPVSLGIEKRAGQRPGRSGRWANNRLMSDGDKSS
jgi:hypothetical protein